MAATISTRPRAFTPDVAAIYLTDNGRSLCGDHLGMCAALTGRDISGQRIYRLTADDVAFWKKNHARGHGPKCENCGKEWTR